MYSVPSNRRFAADQNSVSAWAAAWRCDHATEYNELRRIAGESVALDNLIRISGSRVPPISARHACVELRAVDWSEGNKLITYTRYGEYGESTTKL